jgi:hypothetical protein
MFLCLIGSVVALILLTKWHNSLLDFARGEMI